ncbi:hypothetical protein AAC387_Pa08g0190 [Persea americana]
MAAQKPSIPEGDEEYSMLKDLRISLEQKDGAFSLCLWIYLSNYTLFPATIIRQTHPDTDGSIPLLALNEEQKLLLFPMLFLHEEAPQPCNSASWTNVPCIAADTEFPLGKWVHVGCEVATNFVRLHINGGMVGEKPLSYSSTKDPDHEGVQKITLVGNDGGDQRMQGYVHFVRTYPMPTSISDHFPKNPPLELSIDSSSFSENHEVEESGDGLWSVVGGKASCRRNFSLDVILSDALGCSVQKEMELFAFLVYADNGAPVEKPKDDAEAPLLISYDGVEFPSSDRPIKLINGRASFKLKISQLSSKCENRLFRIQFCSPESQSYPFLEAYSRPIRCISRNRNSRTSSMWKKTATTANQHDRPQSSGPDEGSPKVMYNNGDGHSEILTPHVKYSPPFKRVKVVHEKSPMRIYADGFLEHLDHGCNSQSLTTKDDGNVLRASLRGRLANLERTESIPSDSESVHARNSAFKSMADLKTPISDFILFKFCLGGIYERSILLREVITNASDEDITEFAQQVSLYTGCFHHRQQILIAKQLIKEGNDTWNLISRNQHQVLWKNAAEEIEKKFMKISNCSSRGLSDQDMVVLQRISGCRDNITREHFDKMWYWLYPIASALSRGQIKAMWECTSPKWIEGLITKEEAEASLSAPQELPKPGNFILRFPTSRSWPHPDAGSLIVTYIGADYALRHRLLSLDDRVDKEIKRRPLQDLLLAEPELSQLGRVTRQEIQTGGEI